MFSKNINRVVLKEGQLNKITAVTKIENDFDEFKELKDKIYKYIENINDEILNTKVSDIIYGDINLNNYKNKLELFHKKFDDEYKKIVDELNSDDISDEIYDKYLFDIDIEANEFYHSVDNKIDEMINLIDKLIGIK